MKVILMRFLIVAAVFLFLQNEPPQKSSAEVNLNKQDVANVESQSKSQAATPQPVAQAQVANKPPVAEQPKEVPAPAVPKTNRQIGQEMAAAKGWTGDQWNCLEQLWTRESNWNSAAHNSSSGAHGIAQSLPASKMRPYGEDYLTNPVTQIEFGLEYITNRYGTPCSALSFWDNNSPHWY